MLLPGIKIDTSPSDHVPVDQMHMNHGDIARQITNRASRRGQNASCWPRFRGYIRPIWAMAGQLQ
ncbi:hypothetical protein [Bradyrhizobium sp. AZCC 2230]|uniref:hypothetical protein n=1 Tax=Bradyrhizobium sp. AZCC 2230 TaxID=3117021 RepID=UPI002FF0684C